MAAVECPRIINDNRRTARRHFIRSPSVRQAQKMAALVSTHRRHENALQWTQAVSFNEDRCRFRIQNAAENQYRLRRFSKLYHKNDRTSKQGIIKQTRPSRL